MWFPDSGQDDNTSPGRSFAVGFTLGELSAHTIDEEGNRAFITAKEMDEVRKVTTAAMTNMKDAETLGFLPLHQQ